LVIFGTTVHNGLFDPSVVVDNFGRIIVTAHLFSFLLTALMYFKGWIFQQGNPTGNFILDLFYGYEANPRIFGSIESDIKFFTEGRALICWVLMDFCFAYKQYITLGYLSNSLALVTLLHFLYVLHYFVHESNVLSMIDFTAENMGWMLGWGNLVWVEFCFCMSAWCTYQNPKNLPVYVIVITLSIFTLGYIIFSQTNLQKHQLRTDPNKPIWGKSPKVIKTPSGKSLLISGWWGIGRKMNYTGDLLMAYSFGIPCMLIGVTPFLYAIYLTVLLIHRAKRDNEWCQSKYGPTWDEYTKAVPYQMIPYVF